MSAAREPIAVIGTGYVGLVTAAGFAELGSEVWCVDIDADKVAALRRGEIPIHEPGLGEVVAACRDRMHFSTELAPALEHARLLFVAVGTPPTYSGDADLSAVYAVTDAMPANGEHALVMKSTVPVGTGRALRRRLADQGKEGFAYVSCPEFLKEGSAVEDFRHPDRVVIGDEGGWAGDAVAELYAPLDAPIVRTDIASAEMIKLASNAFLATKISFINEIANLCEETGADVAEVAKGMGMDARIGPSFLRAGIGYGGSCLVGDETVLIRRSGRHRLTTLAGLWEDLEAGDRDGAGLEALAWVPGEDEPRFMPVAAVTRREYDGDVIEVETTIGRRVTCTADHPWIAGDGDPTGEPEIKLASELSTEDWLPLAMGRSDAPGEPGCAPPLGSGELAGSEAAAVHPRRVGSGALAVAERRPALPRERASTGEASRGGASFGAVRYGAFAAATADERFWRVAGLYLAAGHAARDGDAPRLGWWFRPGRDEHLADEVADFWRRYGVEPRVRSTPTVRTVTVRSRIAATWWREELGLAGHRGPQRLPDLAWAQPPRHRWALLSGLWEGGGSWSLVRDGTSVILELGTVSRELADGVLRMLAELGIVASQRTGRPAGSAVDAHVLRIDGAEQVERALELVPRRDRPRVLASIARQRTGIAPVAHRRGERGPAWARIARLERRAFSGPVYSMEVPGAHTFVTTGGVTTHNCFPKDVSALKQLAGNTGYHFQLLTSVIEVNEMQKRRLLAKLERDLGSLVGKSIALLGLAFKPNTDDMRAAPSLVLAARLQAEGAHVRAYDPVAEDNARELMTGVTFFPSALEAVEGAHAVVLVTEWPEFRELDWHAVRDAMAGSLVVDGRNTLDADAIRAAGLSYAGVGRA